jgi:hypothetical protein
MKATQQKPEDGSNGRMRTLLQLLPAAGAQERIAKLSEIDACIATSSAPRFVEQAVAFRNAFCSGDAVIEFCSDRASWRAGMGLAGFLLCRNGADIARLICRMN